MKTDHENAIGLSNVSKRYVLGQMGYRTLREDLVNLFRRSKENKNYFWALKNISFDIKKGESVGIIGDNGAGKSTILKILAGVTNPSTGVVEKKGNIGALIELSAGFHPELTGRENIYIYGAIIGLKKSYIDKRFDEIVEFSGLEQFLNTPIKRYSSGMYARLGFSVTAHLDPDILLIDEVLSVGDYSFQNKCVDKMLEYKKKNVSIIFVSHNMGSVRKLCDRVILLDKGGVRIDADTESVIDEYYRSNAESMKGRHEGRKIAEIKKVLLVKESGDETHEFRPGEKAFVKITVFVKETINNAVFSIFIRAKNGMVIFDVNSKRLDNKQHKLEKGQIAEICYELKMNLLKGVYNVGFNLCGSVDGKVIDFLEYVNNICPFQIKENISEQGIANLEPQCFIDIKNK